MMAQSRLLTFFLLWFLLVFLISVLHQSSPLSASPWSMQNLARAHHPDNASHSEEVPLSRSPSPSALPDLEKVNKMEATLLFVVPPVPSPSDNELALTGNPCSGESWTCRAKNFTACLQYERNARESFLIIQKSGREITFEVNVTFLPSNVTSREPLLAALLMKMVNVTDGIQGSSLIVLDAGGEECALDTNPEGHRLLHPSYGILACLVITIGVGAWGYYIYRLRRSRRGMTGLVRIPHERINTRVALSRPLCATFTSTKDIEVGDRDGRNKSWGEKEEDWDKGKTVAACLQRKHGGGSPANGSHKLPD